MGLLNLGNGVYEYYVKNTKGNSRLNSKQVQKKLTRNVMLSKQINLDENKEQVLCMYGNLHMVVVGDTIVSISNHKLKSEFSSNWFTKEKDYRKFSEYNKELQIC